MLSWLKQRDENAKTDERMAGNNERGKAEQLDPRKMIVGVTRRRENEGVIERRYQRGAFGCARWVVSLASTVKLWMAQQLSKAGPANESGRKERRTGDLGVFPKYLNGPGRPGSVSEGKRGGALTPPFPLSPPRTAARYRTEPQDRPLHRVSTNRHVGENSQQRP